MSAMKKISRLLSILIIAMMTAAPFAGFATEEASFAVSETDGIAAAGETADLSGMTEDSAAADELLVLVEEGTTKREIGSIADGAGAELDSVGTLGDGTKLAKVVLDDPDDARQVADDLLADDSVMLVQPNYLYELSDEQEDDTSETELRWNSKQWYIGSDKAGSLRAADAWKALSQNNKVRVAVIDTGVRLDHPDLEGVVLRDKCVTFNNGNRGSFTDFDGSEDDSGHGTHVCGIIAAEDSSADCSGVTGVSGGRAELIVIDAALSGSKIFTTQDAVLAINYAVSDEAGADIINLSFGGLYHDYLLEKAVNDAFFDGGVLTVCAAGNESSELSESPGDAAGCISVMSHDSEGNRSDTTNFGTEKDVSAPGVDIYSTYRKPGYKTVSGTSMAAPMVAGLAAMLKSEDPSLSPRELRNLIYTSSGSGGFGDYGFGRIDCLKAVNDLHAAASGPSDPEEIILNRGSAAMYPGDELYLEYAVLPGNAAGHADEVSFRSDDESVAEVDEHGRILAKAAGRCVVTASCGSVKAECTVEVSDIPCRIIDALPYSETGYFSPSDPKIRMGSSDEPWEGIADIYQVKLGPGMGTVSISAASEKAEPFIRVYDPDGTRISIKKSSSHDDGLYSCSTSFMPSKTGAFRIWIIGCAEDEETVDKAYTLSISADGKPEPAPEPEPSYVRITDAGISGIKAKTWNGKPVVQSIKLTYNGKQLSEGTDYTVSYSGNRNVGTAHITVTGRGSYTGSVTYAFRILPKGSTVSGLVKAKKAVTVKWKRQSAKMSTGRINGYQIQLSTNAKFTKNVKTVKVKGWKNTSKKVARLRAGKKYYVRVRTYKNAGGRTYCSAWSGVKSVKTK